MRRTLRCWRGGALALAALPLLLTGCDKPVAVGSPTQILVGTSQATWDALEDDITASLEPTTFTVRDERVFDVAHVETTEAGWGTLRATRQILLIGQPSDPAIAEAMGEVRGDPPAPPSVFQAQNVWAQGQVVTVLLIPEGGDPSSVRPLLPRLGETYLEQFEEYARARMFVTGADEELADSLRKNAGFGLTVPVVYRAENPDPNVYIFRNDQPDPASLIRNITVDSRPRGETPINAQEAAAWRASLAEEYTEPPQVTEASEGFSTVQVSGRPAVQIQGIWSNPPGGWPAAGPFITRIVDCPERTFLIDAWLYAPGVPKYEYMYQLNTILSGFECGSGATASS